MPKDYLISTKPDRSGLIRVVNNIDRSISEPSNQGKKLKANPINIFQNYEDLVKMRNEPIEKENERKLIEFAKSS